MKRLENKVAIITGAASGMGKATAKLFASEGAKVIAADINIDGAKEVVKEINDAGFTAIAQPVDIGSAQQIEEMVLAAKEHFGRLDILHNNAARLNFSGDVDVMNMDIDEWTETLRYNLTSVMLGTKFAIPLMLENGGGSIINTASIAGIHPELSKSAYSVAKAGVISLTKSTAIQFGKQGIRANAIAPGMVLEPEIVENGHESLKQYAQIFEETKATPRIGIPLDIAQLALYLASDESSFITGQVISADGGMTVGNPTISAIKKAGIGW
ncbi:SDR family NAD(P)-dependent oxidoreductase [Alkalihalobacillus pseudalcaliphilus]|uniref:SDR family NAD(P)-dependent oxidoreductase n=1 Tax=Alkalihalobacillus pseudalcaliphilus TaxID=79884 RepID=UPI00064DC846|nr:glucose 1-dehydrogenase [Alkalihalobacillus pseudalcaliphilus]KMK75910.1 hypothetical protein AB990_11690 [Alkalihalobacillus pseudalcaliphilus]